jgi:putative transcriptional regulator
MAVAQKTDDLSQLVKSLRELLGLSQEKLAARLGVTFSSVNRWENGHTKPSPLALKQVEQLLDSLGKDGRELRKEFFDS